MVLSQAKVVMPKIYFTWSSLKEMPLVILLILLKKKNLF